MRQRGKFNPEEWVILFGFQWKTSNSKNGERFAGEIPSGFLLAHL